MLNVLEVRKHAYKNLRGRNIKKLSPNALRALTTKKLSKSFWRRWDSKYQKQITKKRQGTVSINRALNCTREMACNHLNELAEELIKTDIFVDAVQLETGVWQGHIDTTRVFNHDETPQFVNYGVDGTPNGLAYAGRGESCQKMIRENRECVTLHPFVSFGGEIAMCHIIFKGKGISAHMAPKEAVEKIPNLLISTNDSGSQDHSTLLSAYEMFDHYLDENSIQRPVVVLSDGHSSRFDSDVLTFLRNKNIRLFISPPDTTGVTQLLDQINQKLHSEYRSAKSELFSPFMTINREGFMKILAELWPEWASNETITNAGKKVGISCKGLSVEWMQADKFARAELCITKNTEQPSSSSVTISSPKQVRYDSAAYWKHKYHGAMEAYQTISEKALSLEEIPNLLPVTKVTPKPNKENVRVTQVQGSMEGKKILEKVSEIKEAKAKKEQLKKDKKSNQQQQIEAFFKCKDQCTCGKNICAASKLRECPCCHNVLKSICSKLSCRDESGSKPIMIKPICDNGSKKSLHFESDDENDIGIEDNLTDVDDDDMSGSEKVVDNADHDSSSDEQQVGLKRGDCVKVVKGNYLGYFALVTGDGYGGETELNYFEHRSKWWVLKEKDLDSRERGDLEKVENFTMDNRSHYYFK